MKLKAGLILLFVLLASNFPSPGQTQEELQALIERTQEEIRLTNQLIEKTRKDQQASENELKLVRSQITNRRDMVKNLGRQIELINTDIDRRTRSVGRLGTELEKLKEDYADMVYLAYKNYKLNNFLLFLFSAADFTNAFRRIDFMRRYNEMREEKAAAIRAVTDSIVSEVANLDRTRVELDETKDARNTELESLAKDEGQYRNSVNQLRTQQTNLTRRLQEQQEEVDKAQRRIQELIAEEARRNRESVTTEAEDRRIVELSGRFEQNKGSLPYPVSGGVVVDKFGEHAHSVVKSSKIVNQGVNIAASAGAEVRCVFDGTVTAIFNASVLNNCIIVRHGDYVTVYANVVTVSVKSGDSVRVGQRLGKLSEASDPDTHFLHFEVLENGRHVNPELWIKR